jgi:hypothetical protein
MGQEVSFEAGRIAEDALAAGFASVETRYCDTPWEKSGWISRKEAAISGRQRHDASPSPEKPWRSWPWPATASAEEDTDRIRISGPAVAETLPSWL